jgi:hypothetical protein
MLCILITVKKNNQGWATVAQASNSSYSGRDLEDLSLGWPGHKARKSSKITSNKRAGAMAQVVEHLPKKYEALSSPPKKEKKRKKEKKK